LSIRDADVSVTGVCTLVYTDCAASELFLVVNRLETLCPLLICRLLTRALGGEAKIALR